MLYSRLAIPLVFLWTSFVIPSFSLPIAQPDGNVVLVDAANPPQNIADTLHISPLPSAPPKQKQSPHPSSSPSPSPRTNGAASRPIYQPDVVTQVTTLPARTNRWGMTNMGVAAFNTAASIQNKIVDMSVRAARHGPPVLVPPKMKPREYKSHGEVSQNYYHAMATAVNDKGPIKPNTQLAKQLADHTNSQRG